MNKVALLITGDEIVSGKTPDTNSHYLARELNLLGLPVSQAFVCGDDLDLIVKLITEISSSFNLLIINGGLGPTVDDYTYQALAKALNQKLALNQQAKKYLYEWFKGRKKSINTANLKQAYLPAKAKVIKNNYGSAPSAYIKAKNCHIFATPGVPKELYGLWQDDIKGMVKKIFKIEFNQLKQFTSFGIGESMMQQAIDDANIIDNQDFKLGFRVHYPYLDLKLNSKNKKSVASKFNEIKSLFSDYILGESDSDEHYSLENIIMQKLIAKKKTVATAESISGGLVSHLLTNVAGASSSFLAGYICYSNQQKINILNIAKDLLNKHGAVSAPVAKAMVIGAMNLAKSDYAVATTGFAGPQTGNDQLGLVFIAIADANKTFTFQYEILGNRARIYNQQLSAYIALDLLRRLLFNLKMETNYSFAKIVKIF